MTIQTHDLQRIVNSINFKLYSICHHKFKYVIDKIQKKMIFSK